MVRTRQLGCLILLLIFAVSPHASEITVRISGGLEKIQAFEENNITYFSMSQLTRVLGERVSWDIVGFSAESVSENHRIIFFVNSPYIRNDDSVKNLTYPVKTKAGGLYLPAATFLPMFDLIRP